MGESSWMGELFNLFIELGHLREYEDIFYFVLQKMRSTME